MNPKKLHKCSQCGDVIAHWYCSDLHHKYYCNDCIDISDNCELEYCYDGFLISSSEDIKVISYSDLVTCFNKYSSQYLSSSEIFLLKNTVGTSFLRYRFGINKSFVEYNKIMSKLGSVVHSLSHSMFNNDNHLLKFFQCYSNELKKHCFIGSKLS